MNRRVKAKLEEWEARQPGFPSGVARMPIDRRKQYALDHGAPTWVVSPGDDIPVGQVRKQAQARLNDEKAEVPHSPIEDAPPARYQNIFMQHSSVPKPGPPRKPPSPPKTPPPNRGGSSDGNSDRHVPRRGLTDEELAKIATPDLPGGHQVQVARLVSGVRTDSPIEMKLSQAKFINQLKLGSSQGLANETRRFAIEGGEVYFKSFNAENKHLAEQFGFPNKQQPIHEVAAWQLAQDLGPEYSRIVAPCAMVEHNREWGSASWGATGSTWNSTPEQTQRTIATEPGFRQQITDAAFFDTLLGNTDRHGENFIADHRGLQLIDHGFAFGSSSELKPSLFSRLRIKLGKNDLTDREKGILDRVLDTSSPPRILGILEKSRADAFIGRAVRMRQSGKILGP
jgi:hypothetical protein